MLCLTITFLTNVMNEKTENNRQTNCFLKSFIRKPISLPSIKSNSRNTDWIVDPFTQLTHVKSVEHMGKINTKSVSTESGAFPNFSLKLHQKPIKRLWNIYKYINFLSITYFPWAIMSKMYLKTWSPLRKGQAFPRREGNKVEILEGKPRR